MTILQQLIRAAWGLAIVTSLVSVTATAALPQGEFACQVETTEGEMGLVLIQSDTREQAIAAARVGTVTTGEGGRAAVTEVVQCITRRTDERFRDADFHKQYLKTPL
jgi:hypothetical protein